MEEEGGRVMVGRRGWEVVGVLATLDGSEVCASGTTDKKRGEKREGDVTVKCVKCCILDNRHSYTVANCKG